MKNKFKSLLKCKFIIPAIWEIEIGELTFEASSGNKN
jgi:hypothetical protein